MYLGFLAMHCNGNLGSYQCKKYWHVLNDCAFPSCGNLIGENFIFQQDNAPNLLIRVFFNKIGTMDGAPKSTDKTIID